MNAHALLDHLDLSLARHEEDMRLDALDEIETAAKDGLASLRESAAALNVLADMLERWHEDTHDVTTGEESVWYGRLKEALEQIGVVERLHEECDGNVRHVEDNLAVLV